MRAHLHQWALPTFGGCLLGAFLQRFMLSELCEPCPCPPPPPGNDPASTVARQGDLVLPLSGEVPSRLPILASAPAVITAESLVSTAERFRGRAKEAQKQITNADRVCGAGSWDGLALLSLAELAQVDIIIESGTAGGVSTELMARAFTDKQIITVDLGKTPAWGVCSRKVADAHQRLAELPNVRAVVGDSFKLFPKLISENKAKRIGLFIDGPKGEPAVKLCAKSLKASRQVQFCALHDVSYSRKGEEGALAARILHAWGRTVMLTCCDKRWVDHFKLVQDANASLAIVAGQNFPWGHFRGDEQY